jgi:ankyrin repeat protein
MLKASKLGMLICEDFVWLKTVLKAGASTQHLDPSGCSALHLAARRGNLKVVIALLENGMDINQKGHNGWYVLFNKDGIT